MDLKVWISSEKSALCAHARTSYGQCKVVHYLKPQQCDTLEVIPVIGVSPYRQLG